MERCRAAGWTLEPEQAEKLAAYLDLLMQWNRAMNLVGTHSWIETLERLVFDSFELARFLNHKVLLERTESALERFAVENGNRSGGRGSGRPRRMSLKTTLFRRNDGSAAFEMGQFQKQNALDAEAGVSQIKLYIKLICSRPGTPRRQPCGSGKVRRCRPESPGPFARTSNGFRD